MSNDVGPEGLRTFTNLLDQGTRRIKNWQFRVERAERYVILHGDRKALPASYMATARALPASLRLPRHYYTTASRPQRSIVVAREVGSGRVGPCGRHAGGPADARRFSLFE